LLTTGGTIGTGPDYSVRVGGAELLSHIPDELLATDVELDDAGSRPSPEIEPPEMLALAKRIGGHLGGDGVAGVVVTYGTDAMDEFVYLVDLIISSRKPVVVTGAMFNTGGFCPDGPRNLRDALTVAASPEAEGLGTLLVMNGVIHAAREVVKVNSAAIDAFSSPKLGPLGHVESGRVRIGRRPAVSEHIEAEEIEPNVDLIAASVGMDGRFVDAAVASGARGIVIASMGGGAIPKRMAERLMPLVQSGFPLVVATRCLEGGVSFHAREAQGALPAGDLPPHKARIKLMLALAAVRSLAPAEASARLQAYFSG
jgi:L-asparaginase